jgi:thiol-disulfide isomerase/thioredoxin
MSGMITKQEFNAIGAVEQSLLRVAQEHERALDAQLAKMDNLGEDDFEALRQKRKMDLQKQVRQEQDWRQLGHGRYAECTDTKDFFNAAKKSARMLVHFYRSVTPRCQIVDAHFERLAARHVECRFVKLDAEKNPYLVEKLGIIVLPTIVLIKDGKTDHAIHGFDEFGGTDNFTTEDMAYVLANYGMIKPEAVEDRSEEISATSVRAGFNSIKLNIRSSAYAQMDHDEDDFDNLDDV